MWELTATTKAGEDVHTQYETLAEAADEADKLLRDGAAEIRVDRIYNKREDDGDEQ